MVERVGRSVAFVSIQSAELSALSGFEGENEVGTAVVVRPDGYLVTNSHVILNADAVWVSLPDGRSFESEVVGSDPISDLAVLKIDAEGLTVATLGGSERLRVGDWVVAIGNALGLKGDPTVAIGIVSAQGRTITTDLGQLYDLIQTDAAINQGTSGGPLVNLEGEVVGINTAILRQATGIGFAISSSVAIPIIESLIEHGRVVRPLIGLTATDVTSRIAAELKLPAAQGVVVTTMSEDGPAYLAGIRVGDVITKLDGTLTPDMGRFLGRLWSYRPGDRVEVEYVSGGESHAVLVTLAERPSP
jgi:S1-C subfamily serine protease